MNQKIWNKVTLKWDCLSGLGTSVHIDGHFDPKLYNPKVFSTKQEEQVHGIIGIEAVSLNRDDESWRRGEIKLDIRRLRGANIPPNKTAIIGLIEAEFHKKADEEKIFKHRPSIKGPETESWTETIFTIFFALGNSEQFCDQAIEIVRAVFTALGVHDERGHFLSQFTVHRDTFVMLDEAWITFARWLRISHRLPIYGPEDKAGMLA